MSAPRETSRALPIALLRARDAVMSHFRPLLAEHGFTEQQWRVLRVLEEVGPLDPTEIAERSIILAPSVTRILRTLEDAGMIARADNPEDGRRYVISITEKGRRSIADALPRSQAIYSEIERSFGRDRMDELLDLLEQLSRLRQT